MASIIKFLAGKKTILVSLVATATLIGYNMGYIPDSIANQILLFCFPASLITLRAGQARLEQKVDNL